MTSLDPDQLAAVTSTAPAPCVIVRIRSSVFGTRRITVQKDITCLRRKCIGFNFFEEDIGMIGADAVIESITNLHECPDGIYQIVICNEQRDWETGHVEDYDYKLIPFTD